MLKSFNQQSAHLRSENSPEQRKQSKMKSSMYQRLRIPNHTLSDSINSSLGCQLRNNLAIDDSEPISSVYASNTFEIVNRFSKKSKSREGFVRPVINSDDLSNEPIQLNYNSQRPTTMGGNINGYRPITISNQSRNQTRTNSHNYQPQRSKMNSKHRNEMTRHISTANSINKRQLMKINIRNNNEYRLI